MITDFMFEVVTPAQLFFLLPAKFAVVVCGLSLTRPAKWHDTARYLCYTAECGEMKGKPPSFPRRFFVRPQSTSLVIQIYHTYPNLVPGHAALVFLA